MSPLLLLGYAGQIFWEESKDGQSPSCCPWAIHSSNFCFYLQEVFKFQSHHLSQRKHDEMVFALTGDSKIWWNVIPYGISLSPLSTLVIKEGNTREFFFFSLSSCGNWVNNEWYMHCIYNPKTAFMIWFWLQFRKICLLMPEVTSKRMKLSMLYGVVIFCCCLVTQSGEGNGTPLQYCCLENPMDRRA